MKNPIEYGLIAALFAVGAVTGVQAYQIDNAAPAAPTINLVMDYQGEAFVIDHGFSSMGDCFAALPHNDSSKGLSFACERKGER